MKRILTSLLLALGVATFAFGLSNVSAGAVPTTSAETTTVDAAPPGNNATLKIHEKGTPSHTTNNDPKVCTFNVEGYNLDPEQDYEIVFTVQGGDGPTGTQAGPFGPYKPDEDGYFETEYFNLDPGHYKATAYGKDANGDYTELAAKSKVFKVTCPPTQTTTTTTTTTTSTTSTTTTTRTPPKPTKSTKPPKPTRSMQPTQTGVVPTAVEGGNGGPTANGSTPNGSDPNFLGIVGIVGGLALASAGAVSLRRSRHRT